MDDSGNLHINTGSKLLQKGTLMIQLFDNAFWPYIRLLVIENNTKDDDNKIYHQLKDKIANRKGSTSIVSYIWLGVAHLSQVDVTY